MSDSETPWTAARWALSPPLSPGVCSNSYPLSRNVIQPSHPLSPSSPPALNLSQHQGPFQWVGSYHQVAEVIEASASASVLPVNIQGWFPLGLTGLITSESRWLSSVFFSTVSQKHQLFDAQPSLWSRPWLLFFNSSYSLVKSLSVLFSTFSNSSNNLTSAFLPGDLSPVPSPSE